MASPLLKTQTPGIYRRGSRYVFRYRDATGHQRWESTRTLEEARRRKKRREIAADDGEAIDTKATVDQYALDWINTYPGRTRRGFREATRAEYRRQLEQYLLRFFPGGTLLKDIKPKDVQGFVAWLEREQPRPLSDSTVQRIMAPVKAMFATAYELDDLRRNPVRNVRLSNRGEATIREDEDQPARAMTREQLAELLAAVDDRWRAFFYFLAVTGVRISEAIALQWKHVQLTGSNPHVKIRQALVGKSLAAPKSLHGRRGIPIPPELVKTLVDARRTSDWPRENDYVFPSMVGTALSPRNVFGRVLKPAADAADVPWVGFHAFRHTCASILIDEGRNILQVSRWLGHGDPGFTLRRYAHLMDEGVGAPLELESATQSATMSHTAPRHTGFSETAELQALLESTTLHDTPGGDF